eukprot:jgi/Chlat1/733/Chrsp104S00021
MRIAGPGARRLVSCFSHRCAHHSYAAMATASATASALPEVSTSGRFTTAAASATKQAQRVAVVRSHAPSQLRALSSARLSSRPSSFLGAAVSEATCVRRNHSNTSRGFQSTVCEAAAAPAAEKQQFEYQAEVSRLMDLIVNSLYSNKEVFLRELVSNASDALDKQRFLSVTSQASPSSSSLDLEIMIKGNPEKKQLIIRDTGVGMTREELLDSLGTIAKSGTAKFMEALQESKQEGDAGTNLIGRFGVGFYSAFLVADKVTVRTKNDKDRQWVWESTVNSSSFTIEEDNSEDLVRGTEIILHLKEDSADLADDKKLSELVKTYSEFISFPIKVWSEEKVPKQVPDDSQPLEEGQTEPKMKTIYESEWDWKVTNDSKPIWLRMPKEVTKDEYAGFFKTTFHEFVDPLAQTHFSAEGEIEFKSILFVPGMAPFENQDMLGKSKNIKLFVKRVFISDEFDENLMPRYLSFVKGVVDSNDLPLNVSREILQESRVVRIMKRRLLRKSLDMLKEIAGRDDDGKDYATFWEAFGRNIKLGVIEDRANHDTLGDLLRFYSSKSGDKLTSLAKYLEGMKENQKDIYYLAADSKAAAENAPFLESLVNKGYEVLFLTEPIDEVAITNLATYQEKSLVDITKEGLDLIGDEEEKKEQEQAEKELEVLANWLKSSLGDKVEKVVISQRVTNTPCLLVTSKFGWSANMERIMKAQAMGDSRALEYMRGRKIMEINPKHPLIVSLNDKVKASPGDPQALSMANLLFDTAMLNSGFQLESSTEFANRIVELMSSALGNSQSPQSGGNPVDAEVLE